MPDFALLYNGYQRSIVLVVIARVPFSGCVLWCLVRGHDVGIHVMHGLEGKECGTD